jgi:hypothetical protein
MNESRIELADLDLDGLDLDTLDIQETGHLLNKGGLESLMLGHGMVELGASSWPLTSASILIPLCCSCCCCNGV